MNSMPLCKGQHVKKYLFDLYKKKRILILSFCAFFCNIQKESIRKTKRALDFLQCKYFAMLQ